MNSNRSGKFSIKSVFQQRYQPCLRHPTCNGYGSFRSHYWRVGWIESRFRFLLLNANAQMQIDLMFAVLAIIFFLGFFCISLLILYLFLGSTLDFVKVGLKIGP